MNFRIRSRSSIGLILAVATLALPAGAASALSSDQLAEKVNRRCETFNRDADRAADNGKTKTAIYTKIYKLQVKLLRGLRKLDPPAGRAARYDRFLAGVDRQRRFLKKARDHAEDEAALERIDKQARKGDKKREKLKRKLGFVSC